MIGTTLCGLKL